MNYLALDTSSDMCSAALACGADIYSQHQHLPRGHGEHLLPMIRQLLNEAGLSLTMLDFLIFGRGPGAFTGLRIGAGVAQGLSLGADVPVVGVSSLATLAQGAWATHQAESVCVAVDARMSEVYLGYYTLQSNELMSSVGSEQVTSPQQATLPDAKFEQVVWQGVGTGWSVYRDELGKKIGRQVNRLDDQQLPNAIHMLPLGLAAYQRGEAGPAETALPVYLRDQVTTIKSKR